MGLMGVITNSYILRMDHSMRLQILLPIGHAERKAFRIFRKGAIPRSYKLSSLLDTQKKTNSSIRMLRRWTISVGYKVSCPLDMQKENQFMHSEGPSHVVTNILTNWIMVHWDPRKKPNSCIQEPSLTNFHRKSRNRAHLLIYLLSFLAGRSYHEITTCIGYVSSSSVSALV